MSKLLILTVNKCDECPYRDSEDRHCEECDELLNMIEKL